MPVRSPLPDLRTKPSKKWQLTRFEALLSEPVRNGVYKSKEFHGRGMRVVNMGELFAYAFISNQEMKRVELSKTEGEKFCLEDGDLLFARRSLVLEGAGKCSLVRNPPDEMTFESSIIRARPNPRLADPRFLYYFFTSPRGRATLASISTRTAVSGIRGSDLAQVVLPVPRLKEQCLIADILSAYDALIENNSRRINILEKIAHALYREWFVEFQFPGGVATRGGPSLGSTPKGWSVKKLSQVASVNRAQISLRAAPEELHYIDISSVSPGRIDVVTPYPFAEAPGRARRIVQHGDVIWSCVRPNRRSHALVMRPRPNTIASTGFAVLTAEKVPFPFLYFATTTDEFVTYLANHATGVAYPAVSSKTFQEADLLIPPEPLLKKFGDATVPMLEEISILQDQSRILRRTRDLLLPKLLSFESNPE